jgi:hypothetical protein
MKFTRKIWGYILVGISAVCVFIGISPLFEIRAEAYLLGLISFAAGAWVLVGPEVRQSVRKLARSLVRDRKAASRAVPRQPAAPVARIDPLLPVRILKLAKERAGTLTVAAIAMELNVPLDQAQAGIDECVRMGNAVPDYDIPHGHALYRFPEFLSPDRDGLSH